MVGTRPPDDTSHTPADGEAAATDLIRALRPWAAEEPTTALSDCEHPTAAGWVRAAESLRLAHDVLASHLGPDRQYLTPDAHLIDEPRHRHDVMALLGDLALTDAVAELRPATRGLPVIDGRTDPLTAAVARVDWLAQRAHDLARGSAEVGSVTMQAFAVLGVTVHQHPAVVLSAAASRANDLLPKESRALRRDTWVQRSTDARAAAEAWRRVYQAWDGVATPTPGSRLVVQQVTETRRNLADITRLDQQWKQPEELLPDVRRAERLLGAVQALRQRLGQIANCHDAVASRSLVRDQVFVQRREAPAEPELIGLSGPRRYVSSTRERLERLDVAYAGLRGD